MELNTENIELLLNEVRPHLINDGGNVELIDIINSVVYLKLQGACSTCPSSTVTLKLGIEKYLKDHLPGLIEVEQVL